MLRVVILAMVGVSSIACAGDRLPIIDMHIHAYPADGQGPPPLAMCTPIDPMPAWDPIRPYAETFMKLLKEPSCDNPVWSPMTDEEVMTRTLAELEKRNVFGVLSGSPEYVSTWMNAAPERFYAGLGFNVATTDFSPEDLANMHADGRLEVLAEVTNQYAGIAPDDERMEPYWAMAEEQDIPVGIHIGTGPPGVRYLGSAGYEAWLHSALTLEPVLTRHPKLRVYIMHAGFPMLDDLLAVLYVHPQVYVGVGVIVYSQPRATFYRYLRGIVDAGFGNRVMFGSDQMVWPETISRSIDVIDDAPFLTDDEKRDILYNNAARFLRLSDADTARHHGM